MIKKKVSSDRYSDTCFALLDHLLTLQASTARHKTLKIQLKERRGEIRAAEEVKEESDSVNNTAANVSDVRQRHYVLHAKQSRQAISL
jgi:hypothetical protein